jgi:hypothetical protein
MCKNFSAILFIVFFSDNFLFTFGLQQLWNLTKELNIFHPIIWQLHADEHLQQFQQDVYEAVKDQGWDGSDNVTTEFKWTYAGALLYAVTVITTIGMCQGGVFYTLAVLL